MKKLVVLSLLLLFIFVGCSDKSSLVGTYYEFDYRDDVYFVINQDGSYIYTTIDVKVYGKYAEKEDNIIVLHFPDSMSIDDEMVDPYTNLGDWRK